MLLLAVVLATLMITLTLAAGTAMAALPNTHDGRRHALAITVSPNNSTVTAESTQQFAGNVSGTSNTSVTWTVSGAGWAGGACGTISASGLYVAPVSVPSSPVVTVTANSVVEPTKSASASVTIVAAVAVLLSISPTRASVPVSGTQLFAASVTGTSNTAVSWSSSGAGCSGSFCGSLSTSGSSAVYAARAVPLPSPASVTVQATNVADPTKSASAFVAFAPQIAAGGLPNGQAGASFQATLTGTGGVTPYKWTLTGGLTLNASSGAISGTPTQADTSTFTILLTDSAAQTAQESSSITIASAGSSTSGPSAQALSLVISGTGINQIATVESSGQFRLVFEASDNWGLSQWYDLVNDPNATTNLAGPVYAVNGPSNPCAAEPGLQNMVFYGDSDAKLAMREAGCAFANNTRSMTVLSSSPSLVVIQTSGHPMNSLPNIDTNITGTNTYYIYPNGQIYIHNTVSVVSAKDLGNGGTADLFISTLELEDPTQQGTIPPDSQGWIRASTTQNPYSYVGLQENYVFAYWGPGTPSPYTNYTKASIMLVPSPNNPTTLYQIIHSWSSGPGYGVVRWGYRMSPGPNMSAGQTIAYDFLLQLGTQGSSVLPNINSNAVAGPIATSYRANPIPPGVTTPPVVPTPPVVTAAPVIITPSGSLAVNQGGTTNFTETAGDPGTWSCAGTDSSGNPVTCRGSVNPITGVYTAPAVVNAQQSVGGYQLLPNNHIFNTQADSLPVHPNSATWIAGSGTHQVIYTEIAKPLNYTDGSTPTQSAVFYYTPTNNGAFQIPAYPGLFPTAAKIEGGWISAQTNQNSDHHLLTIDTTNGNMQDMYQWYAIGLNGSCLTCNSQSGVKYTTPSYSLPANGATDAAGMEITPLLLRVQEVERAIATGGTINHALRFTLPLGYCASSNIWPATTFASDGGIIPFGARFRLKSSFNISGYSPIAQILLTQLKQYGLILADGGTGWSVDVEYAKWPKAVLDAFVEISAAKTISPSNFEAVDESGIMISSSSGETTSNRETVTFTRTSDSATASADLVLTGVAVNFPYDLLQIQVGAPAQQLTALVNGAGNTSVTWSMSPAVGTLSSTGLYTPPSGVSSPTTVTVTATSVANPSVAASMTLNVFPAGPIRLVPGNAPGVYNYTMVPTPYTDSSSNVWSSIGDDGGYAYNGGCSIAGTSDPTLYCYEYTAYAGGDNDQRFDFIVPNGSYQINYKAASTFGTLGTQIQDLEVNGNIVYPNLDLYAVSGGSKIAWDWNTTVSLTNNRLSFVLRVVNNAGTRIGAVQITP
jgi:Putative Ig domain